MTKLTHLNDAGEAHMVDVGTKPATAREAVAEGQIRMQPENSAAAPTAGLTPTGNMMFLWTRQVR